MIVEHAFGLLVKDRFFKLILEVDSDDPNKKIKDMFHLMHRADVTMNLSTGEKLKDRWDIHPTIYQRLFGNVWPTRNTDDIHIWAGSGR